MTNWIETKIIHLQKTAHLTDRFSINQQIQLVDEISQQPLGLSHLLSLLIKRRIHTKSPLSYIDGIIFKSLYTSRAEDLQKQINYYFKNGIVQLKSFNNIDYVPLYHSLISNNFQEANLLTQIHLNELAGLKNKKQREWLYFTDVIHLPAEDLITIDTLWRIYSAGLFGFSIQRKIWLSYNQDWEKLWHKIGWKIENINTRYPNEFVWDSSAPQGHLPLFNQLRGVQVLAALFKHSVWNNKNSF